MIVKYKNKKLTDNTSELDKADLFLLTKRNKQYFEEYKDKIESIEVEDLIKEWELDQINFVGITGTKGKNHCSYSYLSYFKLFNSCYS